MSEFNVGENLRKIRIAHKLTQTDVADNLGLERSTYTCYEIGKTEPAIKSLVKIGKMYNLSLNYILTGEEFVRPVYSDEFAGDMLSAETDLIGNLSKDEIQLIAAYRMLDPDTKIEAITKIKQRIK